MSLVVGQFSSTVLIFQGTSQPGNHSFTLRKPIELLIDDFLPFFSVFSFWRSLYSDGRSGLVL